MSVFTMPPAKKIKILKPRISEEELRAREELKRTKIEEKLYRDKIRTSKTRERFYEASTKAFEAEEKARRTAERLGMKFESYEERMKTHIPASKEPIFTKDQFQNIMKCLHPDSRKGVSVAQLDDACQTFSGKKDQITK